MKVVIAPDSFKESLSAAEAASQIEAGFRDIFPDALCLQRPMADGGEGTVAALVAATGGQVVDALVTGPLGDIVDAYYGITGDGETAILEMAAACGLAQVPLHLRNPLITTSAGVGELIRLALDSGLRSFIVGIGGSATNDGGAGMVQALGIKLLDRQGEELKRGGGALLDLATIDASGIDPRLAACSFKVACDVDNPLCGAQGASAIFGPQKGASPGVVALLDRALGHYARIVERVMQRAVADLPGAGAAGGMGAAMLAFCNAELLPGIDIVTAATGLEEAVRDADLVITGEGRIDGQSVHGKTPVGVARIAARYKVPVIGIAGSLGEDADLVHQHGISSLFSIVNRPCTLEAAYITAAENLRLTTRNIAAAIKVGMTIAHH